MLEPTNVERTKQVINEHLEGFRIKFKSETMHQDDDQVEIKLIPTETVDVFKTFNNYYYNLRLLENVLYVDPLFKDVPVEAEFQTEPAGVVTSYLICNFIIGPLDYNWALDLMNVKTAWEDPDTKKISIGKFKCKMMTNAGTGIKVAHTDTGYSEHPQLTNVINKSESIGLYDIGDGTAKPGSGRSAISVDSLL